MHLDLPYDFRHIDGFVCCFTTDAEYGRDHFQLPALLRHLLAHVDFNAQLVELALELLHRLRGLVVELLAQISHDLLAHISDELNEYIDLILGEDWIVAREIVPEYLLAFFDA